VTLPFRFPFLLQWKSAFAPPLFSALDLPRKIVNARTEEETLLTDIAGVIGMSTKRTCRSGYLQTNSSFDIPTRWA
jgi:hypothetical protein